MCLWDQRAAGTQRLHGLREKGKTNKGKAHSQRYSMQNVRGRGEGWVVSGGKEERACVYNKQDELRAAREI